MDRITLLKTSQKKVTVSLVKDHIYIWSLTDKDNKSEIIAHSKVEAFPIGSVKKILISLLDMADEALIAADTVKEQVNITLNKYQFPEPKHNKLDYKPKMFEAYQNHIFPSDKHQYRFMYCGTLYQLNPSTDKPIKTIINSGGGNSISLSVAVIDNALSEEECR